MQGMSPCLEFCESNGHCLAVFEGIRPGLGPLNGNSTVTVCSVHASKIGRFKLCQRFHQENSVIRSNQKHPWPSGNLCIVRIVQHIASVINFPFVSWLLLCRKWVAPQMRSGTPFMPWKWACVLQSGHIEIDSHVQLIGASLAVMTCLIRDCIGEG